MAAALLLTAAPAFAHDVITTKVTWSAEISRLVYRRCLVCHADFASYADARPWAKAMKEETGSRRMPPWQAVKGFGDFKDDHGLTQEEIELISDWVEGGAPEGDPKLLPAKPKLVRWQVTAVPGGTTPLPVSNGSILKANARVVGVRPARLAPGASVQVVATRPDGTAEPLVWIYQYNTKFQSTYYYRLPVSLPAGARIEVSPPGAAFTLFTKQQ